MNALLPCLVVLFCLKLNAQPTRQKIYLAKVITMNDTITGVLFECTDSTLSVVDMKLAKASIDPSYHEIEVIPTTDLIHIKIRRAGSIQRGALTLGLLGGFTGAIIGIVGRPEEEGYYGAKAIDTFSTGYYGIQGALIGVAIGGTLGVIVGSGSKNFPINQQQDVYRSHKEQLAKYRYIHKPTH